jgi:hypothetical protein|tara:strand:- start:70 stop:276 length:207 start_codon:yes stop_codon:yes gene_type:complete
MRANYIMKKAMEYLGAGLIVLGLIAMAGAGGDCDGKCGPGNSIAEMLTIASIGLAMFGTGFFLLTQKD